MAMFSEFLNICNFCRGCETKKLCACPAGAVFRGGSPEKVDGGVDGVYWPRLPESEQGLQVSGLSPRNWDLTERTGLTYVSLLILPDIRRQGCDV